jgi:hypothetical protein
MAARRVWIKRPQEVVYDCGYAGPTPRRTRVFAVLEPPRDICSALNHATVYTQNLPGDPTAIRPGEERHHIRNVVRLAQAA